MSRLGRQAIALALAAAAFVACQGTPAPVVTPKKVASPKAPVVAAAKPARSLKFVASTKDGAEAKQPEPIDILVNGKEIPLERETVSKLPTVPADTDGTVDVDLANGKKITTNVKPVPTGYRTLADQPTSDVLSIVVLPWKETQLIGEALGSFKDFATRLKARAVHYPLGLTAMTDANVAGVYIGHYRLARHMYYVANGDLYADPSSEYYLRITKTKTEVANPPMYVAYKDADGLKGVTVTVDAYPAALNPPASPPPAGTPFIPAPTIPDKTVEGDAAKLHAGTPAAAASLGAFEASPVAIDDAPFPDPGA